jgi:DsbC/DsbD-like thiol-disulfide interchange protein
MTSRFRFLTMAAAALAAATAAQPSASAAAGGQQPPAETRTETRHVILTTSASPLGAGGAVLNLDVALKPKMHVYAPDQPKGQDYMPIAVSVAPGDAYRLEKPRYPPAEKLYFAALKETQHVYSKPFRITQPLVLTRAAAGEPLTITGTVRYQACDDAICYVPQTVAVKWRVVISGDSRPPGASIGGQEIRRKPLL